MPIEIRELVIRAVTSLESQGAEGTLQSQISSGDKDVIIQECIKQILKILKKKKER